MSIPPPPSYNGTDSPPSYNQAPPNNQPLPSYSESQPQYLTKGAAKYGRPITRNDYQYGRITYGRANTDEMGDGGKIVRYAASEYPGYGVPVELEVTNNTDNATYEKIKYGFVMDKEMAPFINLKTLTYRPYDKELIQLKERFDVTDTALVVALIDFMNMQTLPVRIALAKELTQKAKKNPVIFKYTTSDDNHTTPQDFHAFDIITFIQNNRKYDTFDLFLNSMKSVREKTDIKYKGFVLNSLNRGNKTSYKGKNIKYKGMINCCINDDNNCTNIEKGFLFGTRRKKDPKLCTYSDTATPRSNPVPRTIFSGGRRRTRHKRRTRRTRL
jgi:hypothetical protein